MSSASLKIEGMSCGHCVQAVERALGRLPAVQVEKATVGDVAVLYDPARADLAAMSQAVADAGYRVAGVEEAP